MARKANGLRGSGRNKTRKQQRDYQFHVRAMILSGQVNLPNGSWTTANSSTVTNKSHQMAMSGCAGYRCGG